MNEKSSRSFLRAADGAVAVLAHRGRSGPWRENTLEAFRGALALGADGVELDVRRCADGQLVVHHDDEVGAGTPIHLRTPIHQSARSGLPRWVPTLDEALEACAGSVVNVEIKPASGELAPGAPQVTAAAVATRLGGRGPGPPPVVVSSFWPAALAALRAAAPAVPTGLLVHPAAHPDAALVEARELGCVALHAHVGHVTAGLTARARAWGLGLVTWTVNDEADLRRVVDAGVDAVITDRVTEVLSALDRPALPGTGGTSA